MTVRVLKWGVLVVVVFGAAFGYTALTDETPIVDGGLARVVAIAGIGGLTLLMMRVLRLGRWQRNGDENA